VLEGFRAFTARLEEKVRPISSILAGSDSPVPIPFSNSLHVLVDESPLSPLSRKFDGPVGTPLVFRLADIRALIRVPLNPWR